MQLIEPILFLINGITLIHALRSIGPIRAMRSYIPIGLTATFVDNVVILAGNLQYSSNYLLWLGNVPLATSFTWGSIIYVLQMIRSSLDGHYGIRLAFWNPVLAATGMSLDAVIEQFVPSKLLGWNWAIENSMLKFPIRNSLGWFLILGSTLAVDDWVNKNFRNQRVRLFTMCCISFIQIAVILIVLVCVGWFVKT